MLEKAKTSSKIRKGIQPQIVTLNLSEPKNRHIALKPDAELATQMTVTASVIAVTGKRSFFCLSSNSLTTHVGEAR